MKKIYFFSKFPSKDDPTSYYFIKQRVKILQKHYDLTVITVKSDKEAKNKINYEEFDGINIINLHIKKISIPKLRFFYTEIQIQRLLKKYIKINPPDLIHVHFTDYFSWIIYNVCSQYNIPYIITEHASFFEKKINQFYIGPKMKLALNNAKAIISVSPFLKKTINKYITRNIAIVPNVIDTNKFNIFPQKNYDPIKIITIGNLKKDDVKGYELLLMSLKKLKDTGINFECDIIGEGPNKKRLQEKIATLGLQNAVSLIGTVDNEQIPQYLNSASFFVSSSRIETFGVAIIEAMSCGKPIVATKSGGPESFITSDVGILTDQEVQSLYESIKLMLQTYKTYNPYVIRNQVINNFSEDVYYKKIRAIYKDVV